MTQKKKKKKGNPMHSDRDEKLELKKTLLNAEFVPVKSSKKKVKKKKEKRKKERSAQSILSSST